MKTKTFVVTAAALVALLGVFCGKEKPAPAAQQGAAAGTGGPALPAEALQPLTEEELATFKKALPGVGKALEAANYYTTIPDPDDPLPVYLGKIINPVGEVAGVADALARAGTNLKDFRATHWKLSLAAAAVGVDMAKAELERMASDTSAQARDFVRRARATERYCTSVPEANKQMMQKHADNLQDMAGLVRLKT